MDLEADRNRAGNYRLFMDRAGTVSGGGEMKQTFAHWVKCLMELEPSLGIYEAMSKMRSILSQEERAGRIKYDPQLGYVTTEPKDEDTA